MAVQNYCPHCGTLVATGAGRCPTCGAPLHDPPFVVATSSAGNVPPPQVVRAAGPAGPAAAQSTASQAPAPTYATYPAPGYPAYPQGVAQQTGYPYAAPPPSAYPYPYQYYGTPFVPPRRAPGETYASVVAWIITILGAISILAGLLAALICVGLAIEGLFSSLLFVNIVLTPAITGVAGGVYAMITGISRIRRKQSQRFTLPSPWLFLGLTVAVMVVGVTLWNLQVGDGPGAAIAIYPLNVLSAAIPAFGILAFAAWRLRFPASRRHVWLSLIYGLTLGPLIAIILEILVTVLIDHSMLSDPNALNPNDPTRVIQLLVEISIAAPIVEEMVKPLGAVLIMSRLKTASAAFLVGLAGGVGFAMFESVFTYIGTGDADWISVALQRAGSSILHGLGAGMVSLAWFYIFHGQNDPRRWLKALGCAAYAVFQHGLNNASAVLISFVPGPAGSWFASPFYLGKLPMQIGVLPFYGLDVAMFVVLVVVTGRLARGDQTLASATRSNAPQLQPSTMPAVTGGAAL